MTQTQLIDSLSKKTAVITTKELKDYGVSHYKIKQLLEEGIIERLKRGVYLLNNSDYTEHGIVQRIIPTGIFCMHSAAALYNYGTYIPNQYHLAIGSKEHYTLPDFPSIKLYYWKNNQYEFGIQAVNYGPSIIKVYDKEKTVCDFIKFRNKQERIVVNQIIKSYLRDEDRDLNKLQNYAKKLSIQSILKTYLDILL